MWRRWIAGVAACAMLLPMSGCSFVNLDMEKQLRAPHAAGEQSAIQTALEEHIFALNAEQEQGTAVSYVLKYPRMGDYRSAFIMKDMNGDGKEEALAFYAMQPEGANSHIALLRKIDGVWQCTDDIEGLATEVERIHFGDLDGNGTAEIFAGYSMYNTRDRRLMLYSWENDVLTECYSDTYSHMLVGHMTARSHDDLLLFRLNNTDKKTSVKLLSLENGEVVTKGETALDGNILSFQDYQFAQLDDDIRGVYQDCTKDSNTTITELILWDGETLSAPLYDATENITSRSARESGLPFKDIDGDKIIEWPISLRLPGDESKSVDMISLWLTEWYTWDVFMNRPEKKQTSIVNVNDGYQLTIPEEWIGRVTATYDAKKHKLSVLRVVEEGENEELFHVVAFPEREKNPLGDDYVFLKLEGQMRYEMKLQPSADSDLKVETVRTLFSIYK